MSHICGLTQDRVIYLRELTGEERVPLIGGRCQNLMPDGNVCGQPLSAHPTEDEKKIEMEKALVSLKAGRFY